MAKKINCKKAEFIDLEFDGGEAIKLKYAMRDLMNFNDFDGGMAEIMKEKSVPELCAKIVYAGAKNNNDEFTHEKARELVSSLDCATINLIMQAFAEEVGTNIDDVNTKKQMAQILKNLK